MIKIKNAIAKTIKNIGKLITFSLLCIVSFGVCCLLGSWTIDNNGNLVGENLIPNDVTYNNYGITLTNSNSVYTINGTAQQTIYITLFEGQSATIDGSIFSYNFFNTSVNDDFYIGIISNGTAWDFRQLDEINESYTFNMYNTRLTIMIRLNSNGVFNNLQFSPVMVKGENIPTQYEPYGIYYSQTNYDNKYNQGKTEGYTEGYQQATRDIVNQYSVPIIETDNISQVTMEAYNDNISQGRLTFSVSYNQFNNRIELWNINTVSTETKALITIYLKNSFQITEFKSDVGFLNVIIGENSYNASYDGTNYIIDQNTLLDSSSTSIIKIEISPNVRSVYYKIKGNITNANAQISAYESGIEIGKEKAQNEIDALQNQYDTLLEHYNNAQMENPLTKMVIAVADIPLNLFHSMFNFDIMGFNLAAFILGIITILLVAYVIKLFL